LAVGVWVHWAGFGILGGKPGYMVSTPGSITGFDEGSKVLFVMGKEFEGMVFGISIWKN
jgi:hypothetical protein